MDVRHHKTGAPEFPLNETHGIALWPKHRLLVDSRGLGWRDVYTSLATENSWSRTLGAVPHVCLAYCVHGAASVNRKIDGEGPIAAAELRPRLFGVVPENRPSIWNLRGHPSIQLVYLRRAMIERIAEEVLGVDAAGVEVLPRLGFADPLLEQLMLELLESARRDGGGADGLYADHIAQTIALRVLRRHAARPPRASSLARPQTAALDPRMRHVRELIESALDENLSLERLAREAGIGAHAFTGAFLRAVGITPHRYVLERRVERAKALLLGTELPIVEIALKSGFASQSHLATMFKRHVGETPRAFRLR
jgi:AraC family transcriptional regulator